VPELLIMRHAKSDWGSAAEGDIDRPLARRGEKAAKRTGRFLAAIGSHPDLILSSPAVRARSTAELVKRAGKIVAPIEVVDGFYGGGWADVLEGVVASGSAAQRILVTGHEPTWSDLVSVLTGGIRVAMPTAAVACLEVLGSWSNLGPGCAELHWHVTPKLLKPVL
jgi:phosphohistidine phosphatase